MAKSPVKKPKGIDAELRPDAWARFERAVDLAANRSPVHKAAKPQKAASRGKPATRKARKKA